MELLRYNNLAGAKYEFVGKTFESFGEGPQDKEKMDVLCEELRKLVTKEIDIFYRM